MTSAPLSSDWPHRVAVIGVGLLGGSVALSLRRRRPDAEIFGVVRDASKGRDLIQSGMLSRCTDSIEQACQDADCVVVATPVDQIAEMAISAAEVSPADCLITDVGSTKLKIVQTVATHAGAADKFVAAHPIAGSEKSGPEFSSATLFDDKPVVITPGVSSPDGDSRVARAIEFWSLVGGQTVVMTAHQHDVLLASVSHVPHLVSALVAKMLPEAARPLVGSGWRDITRVAAGDPAMWTAICAANRDAIVGEMDRLGEMLDHLRQLVSSADDGQLKTWLTEAKTAKELSR